MTSPNLPPELCPLLVLRTRLGTVNNIGITLAHQSKNFGIDRQVHADPEVYFALAQGNFVKYNLKL